jgi:hypothetical protein
MTICAFHIQYEGVVKRLCQPPVRHHWFGPGESASYDRHLKNLVKRGHGNKALLMRAVLVLVLVVELPNKRRILWTLNLSFGEAWVRARFLLVHTSS